MRDWIKSRGNYFNIASIMYDQSIIWRTLKKLNYLEPIGLRAVIDFNFMALFFAYEPFITR